MVVNHTEHHNSDANCVFDIQNLTFVTGFLQNTVWKCKNNKYTKKATRSRYKGQYRKSFKNHLNRLKCDLLHTGNYSGTLKGNMNKHEVVQL